MDFSFGKPKFFQMSMFCKLLTTTISLCYYWTGRPMTYLFTIHKKATSSSVLHLDDNKIRGHTECTVRHQPNILHSSPSRQTQSIKCSHSVPRKKKKITHSDKLNFTIRWSASNYCQQNLRNFYGGRGYIVSDINIGITVEYKRIK